MREWSQFGENEYAIPCDVKKPRRCPGQVILGPPETQVIELTRGRRNGLRKGVGIERITGNLCRELTAAHWISDYILGKRRSRIWYPTGKVSRLKIAVHYLVCICTS